jgi:hypothetical protein
MSLFDADYCRKRAEEARSIAEQVIDPHSKAVMRAIAKDYESLANHACFVVIDSAV